MELSRESCYSERGDRRYSPKTNQRDTYSTGVQRSLPTSAHRMNGTPPVGRDSGEASSTPRSRRPALERLSLSAPHNQKHRDDLASTGSERLQDVKIQYEGDDTLEFTTHNIAIQEERIPATLRLGPAASPVSEIDLRTRLSAIKASAQKSSSKATKRKTPRPVVKKKVARSPLQGMSTKKRNVIRGNNSPRKRRREQC